MRGQSPPSAPLRQKGTAGTTGQTSCAFPGSARPTCAPLPRRTGISRHTAGQPAVRSGSNGIGASSFSEFPFVPASPLPCASSCPMPRRFRAAERPFLPLPLQRDEKAGAGRKRGGIFVTAPSRQHCFDHSFPDLFWTEPCSARTLEGSIGCNAERDAAPGRHAVRTCPLANSVMQGEGEEKKKTSPDRACAPSGDVA